MKARYGRGASVVDAAKAHVRDMAHRPGQWGNVTQRELWVPTIAAWTLLSHPLFRAASLLLLKAAAGDAELVALGPLLS